MYSGCFGSPKAAAEVVEAWMGGDLLVASTEVLDLDENAYRDGGWSVRLYAEAMTPSSPRWMQGAKEMVESASDEVIEGIAEHVRDVLMSPERLVIWGSGGTLRRVGEIVGLSPTLLGIDASVGDNQVGTDLSEGGIDRVVGFTSGSVTILLSPMGGQGFLIGRAICSCLLMFCERQALPLYWVYAHLRSSMLINLSESRQR